MAVVAEGWTMLALMSPKLWLAVILAVVLGFTHFTIYRAGKASVRADWNAEKVKDEAAARSKEAAWQASADQTTKAKDDQIRTINRKLVAALGELRNRPERPAVLPENSSTCRSGTGAGLYRTDSEFLAGLAARADTIAAERDACYAQYNELRAPAGR